MTEQRGVDAADGDTADDGMARYLVGVVKRATESERTTFREVFPTAADAHAQGWLDALGAEDDGSAAEPGEAAVFSVELTPEQVAVFAGDPDVRWVELRPVDPQFHRPVPSVRTAEGDLPLAMLEFGAPGVVS